LKTRIIKTLYAVLLLIFVIALSFSLSGCGFLSGNSVLYSNDTGLTIIMPEGMKSFSADGFAMAYHADDVMMSAVKENFSDYTELELNLEAMRIEEYAQLTQEINGLEHPFTADESGNFFVTYNAHIDGQDFFYYSTIRKGTDAFWVVTFACPEKHSIDYLPAFEIWSTSIVVE